MIQRLVVQRPGGIRTMALVPAGHAFTKVKVQHVSFLDSVAAKSVLRVLSTNSPLTKFQIFDQLSQLDSSEPQLGIKEAVPSLTKLKKVLSGLKEKHRIHTRPNSSTESPVPDLKADTHLYFANAHKKEEWRFRQTLPENRNSVQSLFVRS